MNTLNYLNYIEKYQTPAGPLPVSSLDIKGGLKLIGDAIKTAIKKTGVTNAINSAGKSLSEFLDEPVTILYAHSPFLVVGNGGKPLETTLRRGDVVKTVTTAAGIPGLMAGAVTAGAPAILGGVALGSIGTNVGSKAGKKIGNLIGTDENGTNLLSGAGGIAGGFVGGVGPTRTIANRNIIAYNNIYPFGYSLKSINLKGLTKDVLTGFLNPFKRYKPTRNIDKHISSDVFIDYPKEILSRDAAFRKALKIDPLPEQKGLYYNRPDGTVGINYKHPLVDDRDIANIEIFNEKLLKGLLKDFTTYDVYTKGSNGGNIGVKDFKYNPDTKSATFTTYDTWDLHPLLEITYLPKFIRNIEFVKLAGGKPFKWVDNLVVRMNRSQKNNIFNSND